ncbi:MAG: penicillin-binding protein activator [Halothiobacillaceae bacterium]
MTGLIRGYSIAIILALFAGLLSACAPQQPPRPDTTSLERALAEAERQQDPLKVANLVWRKASLLQGAERADIQLHAIETLIDADKPQNALALLRDPAADRTAWQRFEPRRARIVQGFEWLQHGRQEEAIRALEDIPAPLGVAEAARRLELLARALEASERPLEAARERIALDGLLTEKRRPENQKAILRLLGAVGKAEFEQALLETLDPLVGGWLQLAHANRQGLEALIRWRQAHPTHPILPALYEQLKQEAAARRPLARAHIALILPQDARLAEAVRAITAGVMLAREEAGEKAPEVREYPGAQDAEGFRRNVDEALAAGATAVIGPLDRKTLQSLAQYEPRVPMIALNTLENVAATNPNLNLIQFGLPPEDEAQAVAERLLAQGRLRALVLAPQDALGERMLRAFTSRYAAGKGQLVETLRYGQRSPMWEQQARQLLRPVPDPIDGSLRMREDADALFLIARARDAQAWVPLLRANGGGNLPILATSHVYDGAPRPASDRNVDGLQFCDMPLILNYARRPGQTGPSRFEQAALSGQPRLFALGYDAYLLATRLDEAKRPDGLRGQTGTLRLDANNRVHRTPTWALFRGGLANPLDALQP